MMIGSAPIARQAASAAMLSPGSDPVMPIATRSPDRTFASSIICVTAAARPRDRVPAVEEHEEEAHQDRSNDHHAESLHDALPLHPVRDETGDDVPDRLELE